MIGYFLKFLKTVDYKEENDFLQDLSKNSKTAGWVYEKGHEKNGLNRINTSNSMPLINHKLAKFKLIQLGYTSPNFKIRS